MVCYNGCNCIAAFSALSVQGYPGDFQTGWRGLHLVWHAASISWIYCGNAMALCVKPHCTGGAGQRTDLGHQAGVTKLPGIVGNLLVSDHSWKSLNITLAHQTTSQRVNWLAWWKSMALELYKPHPPLINSASYISYRMPAYQYILRTFASATT